MFILEVVESEAGPIFVAKARANGALLYLQHGWCQTEADSQGISYSPYIHAMFDLVIQSRGTKILMIGCGGGALATMLAQTGLSVTVIDTNASAIDIARRYFSLPEGVTCYIADGLTWLRRFDDTFDCIIVDAFTGDKIPDHLCSSAFFLEARCHLSISGLLMMNVIEESDCTDCAREIVLGMRTAGLDVRLLEESRAIDRNLIVIGGLVQGLEKPTLQMPPAGADDQLCWNLHAMSFREPIIKHGVRRI